MPAQPAHTSARFATPYYTPTPHPQRCEYTSKRCENARALKPNGERHRLCDYHRRLANNNQRRWQNRKKLHQRVEQTSPTRRIVLGHATSQAVMGQRFDHTRPPHHYPESAHSEFPHPALESIAQPAPSLTPSLSQSPSPLQTAPCVLPRLRQHHVLSHALSLPVSQAVHTGISDGHEFGGVLRATVASFVPPLRDTSSSTHQSFEYERSASEPVYYANPWRPHEEAVRRETTSSNHNF